MSLGLFWHQDIFLHDLHAAHAVMARDRIQRITAAVMAVDGVIPLLAAPASDEQLAYAHAPEYLAKLARADLLLAGEHMDLALDTDLTRYSWRAMRLSAGAACQAVDAVLEKRLSHAFCSVYAGHHAEYRGAGGFCFINSTLIAAYRGLHHRRGLAGALERVAVLDFDVHSGNGTVLGLFDRPRDVLFTETYQPGYPGAFLQKMNRPAHILRKKCENRRDFLRAWTGFFEKLRDYQPQLVVVSAGFDAHRADPLGTLGLWDEDYVWLADGLLSLAAPVVATLEGGYSVPDAARCAALFVASLAKS